MHIRASLLILCVFASVHFAEDGTPAERIRERLDDWAKRADAAKKAEKTPGPARKLAIAVGVGVVQRDVYGFDGRLAGAERDARGFRERFAAAGATTSLILNEEATVRRLVPLLRSAAKDLRDGDTLSLSFSGLGTTLPDYNQSGRAPRNDTAWCLYDGALGEDELFALLSEFSRGVRIEVWQDCGFSPASEVFAGLGDGIAGGLHPILVPADRDALAARIRVDLKTWLAKTDPEADFLLPIRSLPERYRRRYVEANATLLSETQARISIETATGADLRATVRRISVCREDETCPDTRNGGLLALALPKVTASELAVSVEELRKAIRPATSEKLSPQVRRFGPKE